MPAEKLNQSGLSKPSIKDPVNTKLAYFHLVWKIGF